MKKFNGKPCMVLNPPIVFGQQHSYSTCCKDSFATCRFAISPQFFHSSATFLWILSLLPHVLFTTTMILYSLLRIFTLDSFCATSFSLAVVFCVV